MGITCTNMVQIWFLCVCLFNNFICLFIMHFHSKLVNVYVNDLLQQAYEITSPDPGDFCLITIDASAEFFHLRIDSLPEDAPMVDAGTIPLFAPIARLVTAPDCPSNWRSSLPAATSNTRTVASVEPVTANLPSAVVCTAVTASVCPANDRPAERGSCHHFNVPSIPADNSSLPSG